MCSISKVGTGSEMNLSIHKWYCMHNESVVDHIPYVFSYVLIFHDVVMTGCENMLLLIM